MQRSIVPIFQQLLIFLFINAQRIRSAIPVCVTAPQFEIGIETPRIEF